jgi:hypothetical protein
LLIFGDPAFNARVFFNLTTSAVPFFQGCSKVTGVLKSMLQMGFQGELRGVVLGELEGNVEQIVVRVALVALDQDASRFANPL